MNGCRTITWIIMLTPFVLLGVLFVLSPWAGLVGTGLVLGVLGLYLGAGWLLGRHRRRCPACGVKKLKCINWFMVNPPPNYSFHRCEDCSAEFVEVDGTPGLVEREHSEMRDSPGWEAT